AIEIGKGLLTDVVPAAATTLAIAKVIKAYWEPGRRGLEAAHRFDTGAPIDALDLERPNLVLQARGLAELLARRMPVVVAIDDGQLADGSLARLAESLLALELPILIVVATQPTDDAGELDTLVTGPDRLYELALAPLDLADAFALVSEAAPHGPYEVALA